MTSRSVRRGILRSTAAIAFAAAVGMTVSCSSRDGSDSAADGDGQSSFSVVDQRGETVEFDHPIDSAAFAVIPAPSIFAAVDQSYDKVDGINQSTLVANQAGIFGTMFPSSKTTPVISGSDFIPNVDTLLNINPDVVIQWADRGADVIDPIANAGLTVVGLKYGTQEDLETWITLFSQLLGKEERGKELVAWQQGKISEMKERVAGQEKDAERPRAMMLSLQNDVFTTTTDDGYDGFQYDLVGANQVTKGYTAENGQVNPEQIINWDPEVILLSGFDESIPEDIYKDTRLAQVSAVKNKKVYKNPLGGYRWQVPSAESPLYWHWLNNILYPDQETSLRAEVKEAFKELFNYDISDEEIDSVLRIDLNADSTGYDQFNR